MTRATVTSSGSRKRSAAFRRLRPGTTLVELLIFIAILGAVGLVVVPLLFTTMENRLLQQTVAIVEQNGNQMLQTLTLRLGSAERVIVPTFNSGASVVAVYTGSGLLDPTISGVSSGTLIMVRRQTKQDLSSTQVSVDKFRVRNTSKTGTGQSLLVSFAVARSIRLQLPRIYSQRFETLIHIHPDDELTANPCGCWITPHCLGDNKYTWQICMPGTGLCESPTEPLRVDCP